VLFEDRRHAGRVLAANLGEYRGIANLLVLGLPLGGVPVAYEVAQMLPAPLDVFLVRKLGIPGHEQFAMGAIASGGVIVSSPALRLPQAAFDAVVERERRELERRERLYRGDAPEPEMFGRSVVLVDDGLGTGGTMLAAIRAVRGREPARIIVAVPVAAHETCSELGHFADQVVCAQTPSPFRSVGAWYRDFGPPSDEEVRELLDAARKDAPAPRPTYASGSEAPQFRA
jgi:putative phosphoribosyl transferase